MTCGHIKAFGLFPFPHQGKIYIEGLQGQHAVQCKYAGENTDMDVHVGVYVYN